MAEQVIIMRPDELRSMMAELKEDICKEIREAVKPHQDPEKAVTVKEAAAFLGCNKATLWRRFKRGAYPTTLIHRDAGRPMFYKSELAKYQKTKHL